MSALAEPPRIPREIPDWHDLSLCRLFPELDWIDAKGDTATACRAICAVCPVRYACAVGSLERGEPWGIWGGLDRADRKLIAVEYGYPVPAMLPDHGTNARRVKHGCTCPDCKAAHALYEAERRARARAKAKARGLGWPPVHVLAEPIRIGRHRLSVGQYLLPLPGLPNHRRAEPADLPAVA
ncbi:hypothetical protein JOF56_011633 [Kibdelosporangium banguiense]|uniref:4Fe-4S Wbl-type domain-containing protein n=1 Tax=Kibdelosporangium banguiense TaxID=1365924 RepID=A0ABS4U3L0_9PSEU|nr:WhiB family transcriptional regulator [Kibdelosporangium banguiense]MBP2331248.1 hypothetical protein [Kibdelosporangium banguiense]